MRFSSALSTKTAYLQTQLAMTSSVNTTQTAEGNQNTLLNETIPYTPGYLGDDTTQGRYILDTERFGAI